MIFPIFHSTNHNGMMKSSLVNKDLSNMAQFYFILEKAFEEVSCIAHYASIGL